MMSTWNLEGMGHHFLICNGGSCMRKQGEEVTLAIRDEIAALDADALIHTTRTRCNGRCEDACVVIAYPEGVWYKNMTPEQGKELVRQTVRGNTMQENALYYFNHTERRLVPTGASSIGIGKKDKNSTSVKEDKANSN
jgi:(2Fe-2S) ferredoxin